MVAQRQSAARYPLYPILFRAEILRIFSTRSSGLDGQDRSPQHGLSLLIGPAKTPPKPVRLRSSQRGRSSTIVGHPDQAGIERSLAIGMPLARVAKRYGVSKDACC